MGSYDREPEDWSRFMDAAWSPAHVIKCNSKWMGQEPHSHQTVAEVRDCHEAANDARQGIDVWPCSWQYEQRYDDGSRYAVECGAPARYTDRGYSCKAGHEHVTAQVRFEEGWDYASDPEEAAWLRSHGIDATSMRGDSI